MQTAYYQQMIRMLTNGQSWFPPHLLSQALNLAYKAADENADISSLDVLTNREKE